MTGAPLDDDSLLRLTLEAIPGFVVTIDVNGRILFINRRAPMSERVSVIGTSVFEHLPQDQHELMTRSLEAAVSTREPQSYEIIAGPNSAWYESCITPIVRDGGVIAAVITARDITDRKVAAEAVRSSEQRAQAVQASFRAIIERSPDSVLLHRLAETGEPVAGTEYRLLRQDGDVLTFEISPVQRIEFEGETTNLVIGRDVTERKEIEQRLLLSERLASMGSLAACIGNEINNPLTYVVGNLSYIAQGLSGLAETDSTGKCRQLERAVADVREGVDRVRSVVGDLNTLSQPEHDLRSVIDLRRILESTLNVAKNEIRHRARLDRDYSDTPLVYANEALLGQVFLNLLLNAARAIPEGSASRNTIRVSTGRDPIGRAMIEIRDTGTGFSKSYARTIFDPTAPQGPSLPSLDHPPRPLSKDRRGMEVGLGLPICRTIITGLGGEITAESTGASGAVFRVVLPPAKVPLVLERARFTDLDPSAQPVPLKRARILVVDDEPVIAATMKRALDGHDVYIATSGRDALELCRGQSFDLLLCDLMMPDFSGADLFEALERELPGSEQRMIFMTAGAFTVRARRFLSRVSNPWLKKPFEAGEIQAIVKRYLLQKRNAPA